MMMTFPFTFRIDVSLGENEFKFQALSEGLPSESRSRHCVHMRHIILTTLFLTAATLAGCTAIPAGSADPVDPTDPCGAQGHTTLLGSNIAAVTLPTDLNDRVVGPDSAVTQDYDPSRLNIETTADGLIVGLSCG
jgi:hypothetical protein